MNLLGVFIIKYSMAFGISDGKVIHSAAKNLPVNCDRHIFAAKKLLYRQNELKLAA